MSSGPVDQGGLRRAIDNLVSLNTLPAISSRRGLSRIIGMVLTLLTQTLRLDFTYARIARANGGPFEAIRWSRGHRARVGLPILRRLLDQWLAGERRQCFAAVLNPVDESVSLAANAMGPRASSGALVAAASRDDFTTAMEMLLLRAAAIEMPIVRNPRGYWLPDQGSNLGPAD